MLRKLQRIFSNRHVAFGDLLQASPGEGDALFLLLTVGCIELALVEVAFDDDRRKRSIDDELRERGIAADVSLWRGVQRFGFDLAEDKTQVQVAVGHVFDIATTDATEITFVALGHG